MTIRRQFVLVPVQRRLFVSGFALAASFRLGCRKRAIEPSVLN